MNILTSIVTPKNLVTQEPIYNTSFRYIATKAYNVTTKYNYGGSDLKII